GTDFGASFGAGFGSSFRFPSLPPCTAVPSGMAHGPEAKESASQAAATSETTFILKTSPRSPLGRLLAGSGVSIRNRTIQSPDRGRARRHPERSPRGAEGAPEGARGLHPEDHVAVFPDPRGRFLGPRSTARKPPTRPPLPTHEPAWDPSPA